MGILTFGLSVIGSREMNQDAYLISEDSGLYAVADGVGGGLRGEIASRMAIEGFRLYASERVSLEPTIRRLQEDIYKEAIESLGEPIMGTTLTALRITGNEVRLGHIGDSHCYHFTGSVLKLITEDHESFEESLGGPVLSSYLGMPTDTHTFRVQEETFTISPGDKILLCTDGLYRQLSETRIAQLVQQHPRLEDIATALCAEASAADYSDNVTVVLLSFT